MLIYNALLNSTLRSLWFTCSSLLGWGEEHYVSVHDHVATAAPVPASAALLTVPASPATDAQPTYEPWVLVTLWGMVLLLKKVRAYLTSVTLPSNR